ncbi:MAG: hypothetical protein L0027_10230 [Candidatus Rokubacteria bacterium]|nr:hypothetical protein [Candidatus Rokubacteria bacterium]
MVLLLWLYLTGLAILVGAELNSEIEHDSVEGKDRGERAPGELPRLPPPLPTEVRADPPRGVPAAAGRDAVPWPWIASVAAIVAGLLAGRAWRRPRLP